MLAGWYVVGLMSSAPAILESTHRSRARVLVRGQVQGVGFRPYIYRLAVACELSGSVRNESTGVLIEIEGRTADVNRFRRKLPDEPPPGARIESVEWETVEPTGGTDFTIERSDEPGPLTARVPRDRATCADCRREIFEAYSRRRGYPFTNCTACGPRFSILAAMPYERTTTTMCRFDMCAACAQEYHKPDDRWFHAEPNACAGCGPQLSFGDASGHPIAGPEQAIEWAVQSLKQGEIVALKGLGGFQLLTAAHDAEAVARLRQRKRRHSKPFAVMVADLSQAEWVADLSDAERQLLASPENPIVLVKRHSDVLAANIAPNLDTVGLFLPTTPLHHLLLARFGRPLVATSGNGSGEPIAIDEMAAAVSLAGIADTFLIHDRPIVRRLDDSVARVIDNRPVIMRLGRGYAPLPLPAIEKIARNASLPPIVAVGGHLKSSLAVWTGSQAILGPHIGDLDTPKARQAFEDCVRDLCRLYRFEQAFVVCDQHPEYFTTRWARERNLPVIDVQHHHAHAAACMVEHDLLEREVLAMTWDGTGFGPDFTIWGGEILRVHGSQFERSASLLPFALPGGEAAIRRPNRIAFALLWQVLGESALRESDWLHRLNLDTGERHLLGTLIARQTNCPLTSSVGRLFDGIAALVLRITEVDYEGEAAIRLEAIADDSIDECYPLPTKLVSDMPRGDWRPMLMTILDDLQREVCAGRIAGKFHNTLAAWSETIVRRERITDIVLSGGCFQNRLLAERVIARLRLAGKCVYYQQSIPPGDGGLAAGQLAIAVMQMAARSQLR
jgi:hydrogenase maturation protein HypF